MSHAVFHRAGAHSQSAEAHHARARVLGDIHFGGVGALARILLHAREGADPVAAHMTVGELLRALPTANPFASHDLLRHCAIEEKDRVCDLDPGRFSAFSHCVARLGGHQGWEH